MEFDGVFLSNRLHKLKKKYLYVLFKLNLKIRHFFNSYLLQIVDLFHTPVK